MKDMSNEKPMVAICCSTCKHLDKKITEEPCMICSPWCDKWEDKEAKISNDIISHPEVFNNEDNKM